MVAPSEVVYRAVNAADASAIASLHADSWRRYYRGAYSDLFLDGDVDSDRLAVWTNRLTPPSAGTVTIAAAVDEELVGFIHLVVAADSEWGTLVDNLHVRFDQKRNGIGRCLMRKGARALVDLGHDSGLYLWVLEQNTAAQAFYSALGGSQVERASVPAPGGNALNLTGMPRRYRYSWSRLDILAGGAT
jgi:ribosomal protein S18 acetylase RimI-like enzyme